MPTLDWFNRATAFTTATLVSCRLLELLLELHASTAHPDPLVVYGETNRLNSEMPERARVMFKHISYDVRAR